LRILHEKTVLTVTILLRKVARCILGTRNLVLTLLRRQHEQRFFTFRPACGRAGLLLNKMSLKEFPGVRSQESGVRSQESGVRSQESGVRSQESGVRSQESGVRRKIFIFCLFPVPCSLFPVLKN
jgi:hypothetical protein